MHSNMSNVFLFAHQDDEFGVYAEIERLIQNSEDVDVYYLTSGDVNNSYSKTRNEESINVLRKLGVNIQNIHFIGSKHCILDGKLIERLDIVYNELLNIFNDLKPTRLYMLSYEGGHQDHDAVYVLGVVLAKKLNIIANCYQFSLYNGKNLQFGLFRVLSPIRENGDVFSYKLTMGRMWFYFKLCISFKSQKKTWLGLSPFVIWHYVIKQTQDLQKVNFDRVYGAPHSNKLLYEQRGMYQHSSFIQFKDEFIKRSCI